jgi:hypothetical protein
MTYEEILTEAAATSKAYQMHEGNYVARRLAIQQIINALPEDQRIEANNALNPPRRTTDYRTPTRCSSAYRLRRKR